MKYCWRTYNSFRLSKLAPAIRVHAQFRLVGHPCPTYACSALHLLSAPTQYFKAFSGFISFASLYIAHFSYILRIAVYFVE
jgi:hypothetical protein